MHYSEIRTPTTHPYIAEITIDPGAMQTFERLTQDRDEVRLLRRDNGADGRTLQVACASYEVARQMVDGWG